ncbi:TRPM8 channel-associated factor 2-like [Brachionus plicatilis]|uniref:TRPM8 channel-associated factor 2-like n=1 Tax=Brachionus plicatilis TaxID=10195 RepID=A0A3M7SW14_BRAPC|nr:TRPM8 channel-associated factor 2-like [Brachionus plicatilis]
MEKVINSILNEVKYVPKCGAPGNLVVFGPNALPILTGSDCSSVIFAAAEYGKGRVFVTSHELYLTNFTKFPKEFSNLWQNIKNWLTKDQIIDDENDIKNIEDFTSSSELIKSAPKIVKWNGSAHINEIFVDQFLKKYVQNGGSVLCGLCPWGQDLNAID